MVRNLFLMFLERNEWWDQVIAAPDDSRITEFSRGISIELKILIPEGGQETPNSMLGEILLWKYIQKNLTKNITSDIMNIIILYFKREMVTGECWPWKDASRFTSRHHMAVVMIIIFIVTKIVEINSKLEWRFIISMLAADRRISDIAIGQGLGVTIW